MPSAPESGRYHMGILFNLIVGTWHIHCSTNRKGEIMKRITMLGLATVAAILSLDQLGCDNIFKPDTKAVADNALATLRTLRGTATGCYEPGGGDSFGTDGIDSSYVDEIERGVRTIGWLFYDDRGTPFDSTDDVVSFCGQKEYLDWNVTHNVWLKVHIWQNDRATEMADKNITNGDSTCFNLGPVNRPGGIQTGPAFWTDGNESLDMVMGIHHNETPDNWEDNYTFIQFLLSDPNDSDTRFFVHSDFRPDHSGSGEIREQDENGTLVATFAWDNFGRGSLVVGCDIYPFKWD